MKSTDKLSDRQKRATVTITPKARKQLSRLPKDKQFQIDRKIPFLRDNPLLGKMLEGELAGYRSVRVWPYRIIYSINKVRQQVEVSSILHRQGAYK